MGPHAKSDPNGRLRRASAVVRAWDGPNSRIAFEMDLDQMPWGPFEALGKRVTLLVPERPDTADEEERSVKSHLEQALRHVEHAAERCAEFAQLGNGGDQLWSTSLETWEWLRDFLTTAWMEREAQNASGGDPGASMPDSVDPASRTEAGRSSVPGPDMPGAAATLEVAASALRQTPLAVWRDAIGTFNPDAPTREEAIQTLLGVARLLGGADDTTAGSAPEREEAGPSAPDRGATPPGPAAPVANPEPARSVEAPEAGRPGDGPASEPGPAPAPRDGGGASAGSPGDGELSFDYASGYDEGYRMGRRVGRALAAREREARKG